MKSLKDIKTACGRRKIRSAVSGKHSFVGSQQNKPKDRSTYKARTIKPLPPSLLQVQKTCKLKPKLVQKDNSIDIEIPFPQTAVKSVQLNVREDILIIQGAVYYTECLLPFKVQSSIEHHYVNGILHITLKRK